MYYLLIIVILLMYNSLTSKSTNLRVKAEKKYAYFICMILVLLAAFRGDAVGADTESYREHFVNMGMYHSLQDLIDRYSEFYMGYYIPCKFFNMLGMPVQVWFGFVMAFYLYAMMRLINMFSKDKLLSLMVFICSGLWLFSMAGLKQTFAMSMMMLAFVFFVEKKYLWTAILVFLTYYTHQAALIGIACIPLYYVRKKKWLVPFSVIICGLIYSFSYLFMETMVNIMGNEKWETYLVSESQYTYTTFIFYVVITITAFLDFKQYNAVDSNYANLFLGLSLIGCGLQLLAGVSPSLFRLAYLYTPFMMILLPNSVYYSTSRYRKLTKTFLILSMIFYFLYTNRMWPYEFLK